MQPDKSRKKIEEMFDEIAPTYDKLNHLFTARSDIIWRRKIVKYLISTGRNFYNIVDLASGTGDLTIELLKLEPKKIYAVDISKKMLEIQKEKVNDKRLELIQAEAANMPFDDNSIDLVTIGFGIRNFEDLEISLKEIKRVLKNDGYLIILEMFKAEKMSSKLFNYYFSRIMPFLGNKLSKSKTAYNYLSDSVQNFLTVKEFSDICKNNGFETEKTVNNFIGVVNTIYLKKK
ncbi:MAG TPA: bifunctional demethylmenaquinone methyltransferase/2-methoxy-6-polyprenyl-1,4-benzoquinol methylase UbiE [Ignavibacteria bacterium]|nr:bifunctional demethylmenaquinone methyltransferase/2-methoxy-6-polyprenyl-1,4-benzoquinol methylase UbiE [Ignavibacteria bacterium]